MEAKTVTAGWQPGVDAKGWKRHATYISFDRRRWKVVAELAALLVEANYHRWF